MNKLKTDVICIDSNVYQPPIWNDLQAKSLSSSLHFELANIFTTHIKKNFDKTKLRDSDSEVLISITPDQHDMGFTSKDLNSLGYKKIIYINDEPIYSNGAHSNAKKAHLNFLKEARVDVLYYCGNFDKKMSSASCIKKPWYSGLDLFFKKTPKENKQFKIITCANTIDSWPDRNLFFQKFEKIDSSIGKKFCNNMSWSETSNLISNSKIHFSPPHALIVHWLRLLRCWHLGTLPVIFNTDGWLENDRIKECYSDIIQENGKTCLLENLSDFDKVTNSLKDEDYVDSLLDNIHKKDLSKYSIQHTWNDLYHSLYKK